MSDRTLAAVAAVALTVSASCRPAERGNPERGNAGGNVTPAPAVSRAVSPAVPPAVPPAASPVTVIVLPTAAPAGRELRLTRLFPDAAKAGEKVNPQPDGQSAMGFVAQNATTTTVVQIDGKRLPTVFGGPEALSITVPADLLERPGKHVVKLVDGARVSNELTFTVSP